MHRERLVAWWESPTDECLSSRACATLSEVSRYVLLFGTSANPPTGMGGHAGIVSWASNRPEVDEVWVLPVYRHAFQEKQDMPSFSHRMQMAELAFGHVPNVRVLDVERRVAESMPEGELVGTVDVVRWLQSEHPDIRFGLLLGADTYEDLTAGRWKESAALLSMVDVVAIPRPGVDEDLPGPQFSDVSSTWCRNTTDRDVLLDALQPEVLRYIEDHRLYAFSGQDRA